MAKNTVEIGVKVNDDGSVDKLAVSAKKAGKGLRRSKMMLKCQ